MDDIGQLLPHAVALDLSFERPLQFATRRWRLSESDVAYESA